MPETKKYKQEDIQYYLGRISGLMESVQKDVAEIKAAMIPNGKDRLDKTENTVQTLVIWHKSATAVGVVFVAIITWIGGFFSG